MKSEMRIVQALEEMKAIQAREEKRRIDEAVRERKGPSGLMVMLGILFPPLGVMMLISMFAESIFKIVFQIIGACLLAAFYVVFSPWFAVRAVFLWFWRRRQERQT